MNRWGIGPTLRLMGVVVWLGLLANVILVARPDLQNPADFGSDTSNYAAFGERLADRQPLYALSPGDRPVPADNPPAWTVPILSPPQMAVPWAVLTLLPDAIRFYLPWALGVAGTIGMGILFIRRAPVLMIVVMLPLLKGLALTAWSGNVNAVLAPAALMTWWAGRDRFSRTGVLTAGAVAAALGAVKIGPTLLWAWLLGRRPREALIGGLVAVGILTAVVVGLAGIGPFEDYVRIASQGESDPSAASLTGALIGLGVPDGFARLIWLVVCVALAVMAIRSRRTPIRAFAAAAAGLVLLTPVVRPETVSLALLVAGTPWIARTERPEIRSAVAIGTGVAALAVAVSIASGGLSASTVQLQNATDRPLIVRFIAQTGSWGYLVQPGQRGVGWSGQTGGVTGPYGVFDTGCRLVVAGTIDRSGGSYRLDAGGLHPYVAPPAAAYLPYDARCSDHMAPVVELEAGS